MKNAKVLSAAFIALVLAFNLPHAEEETQEKIPWGAEKVDGKDIDQAVWNYIASNELDTDQAWDGMTARRQKERLLALQRQYGNVRNSIEMLSKDRDFVHEARGVYLKSLKVDPGKKDKDREKFKEALEKAIEKFLGSKRKSLPLVLDQSDKALKGKITDEELLSHVTVGRMEYSVRIPGMILDLNKWDFQEEAQVAKAWLEEIQAVSDEMDKLEAARAGLASNELMSHLSDEDKELARKARKEWDELLASASKSQAGKELAMKAGSRLKTAFGEGAEGKDVEMAGSNIIIGEDGSVKFTGTVREKRLLMPGDKPKREDISFEGKIEGKTEEEKIKSLAALEDKFKSQAAAMSFFEGVQNPDAKEIAKNTARGALWMPREVYTDKETGDKLAADGTDLGHEYTKKQGEIARGKGKKIAEDLAKQEAEAEQLRQRQRELMALMKEAQGEELDKLLAEFKENKKKLGLLDQMDVDVIEKKADEAMAREAGEARNAHEAKMAALEERKKKTNREAWAVEESASLKKQLQDGDFKKDLAFLIASGGSGNKPRLTIRSKSARPESIESRVDSYAEARLAALDKPESDFRKAYLAYLEERYQTGKEKEKEVLDLTDFLVQDFEQWSKKK